jgi:hypothetical protein
MPSTIAAGKKGIRDYLQTTPGLTPADDVTVRSADITPEEMTPVVEGGLIILGSVTTTQTQAGLQGRAENPSVSGWVIVGRPGGDETAIDAVRDRAEELLTLIERAFVADPSAAGTIRPPGQVTVTGGALEETPVLWDGSAGRRAQRAFTLSWTSHS